MYLSLFDTVVWNSSRLLHSLYISFLSERACFSIFVFSSAVIFLVSRHPRRLWNKLLSDITLFITQTKMSGFGWLTWLISPILFNARSIIFSGQTHLFRPYKNKAAHYLLWSHLLRLEQVKQILKRHIFRSLRVKSKRLCSYIQKQLDAVQKNKALFLKLESLTKQWYVSQWNFFIEYNPKQQHCLTGEPGNPFSPVFPGGPGSPYKEEQACVIKSRKKINLLILDVFKIAFLRRFDNTLYILLHTMMFK